MRRLPAALLMGTLLTAVGSGCALLRLFQTSGGYDGRPLTIQTLDLFDQRVPSRLVKRTWKGDWMFRRDRLEMVDLELKDVRPDLLILQGVMARAGNGAESDRGILGAGALFSYDWREFLVEEYADTFESRFLVGALSVPYRFDPPVEGTRDSWKMGTDGFLAASSFDFEGQPVDVFNVLMPSTLDSSYLWYSFVQERVLERLKALRHCPKRVIIAGWMPGDDSARRYAEFVNALQLHDVSQGYCQLASNCFTATPTNDIFMATVGDETPTRTDRIYTHQSALIYSSGRNFDSSDSNNRYAREFGLTRLWPAQRFGWGAQVRLARCTDRDLEVIAGR